LTSTSQTLITPAVRAVVFDAVGTLIHPEPPAAVVYAEVGKSFGSRLAPKEIAERFRRAFAQQEEIDRVAGLQTSEEREVRRWRQIVREVLDDASDFESCFQQLFNHFSEGTAWRHEADAARVLPELASRGYTLALASNYDRRLRRVVAGLGALAPVKRLVISSEVGWRKPAKQFFAALSSAIAWSPDQILYVGDDLTNDYDAAGAAGLHAVLYDPQCAAPSHVARVTRLTHLIAPASHP
jgi:putative hydrolase of the HAD superfamily